jgi:hypothetical protein
MLTRSQIYPYPEPFESNPPISILFLYDPFQYYPPINAQFLQSFLSYIFSNPNSILCILYYLLILHACHTAHSHFLPCFEYIKRNAGFLLLYNFFCMLLYAVFLRIITILTDTNFNISSCEAEAFLCGK